MTRGMTSNYHAPDLEHVPTVAELVAMHLATPTYDKGKPARYLVSEEGYALIRSAMRRNARRQRAWEDAGRPSEPEGVDA